MNQIKYFVFLFVLTFASLFFLPRTTAAPVIFTIDNSQSGVGVSGVLFQFPIIQQASNSLITSYSGSINADLSDSTIQFTGGSAINAHTNGNWEPNESSAPNTAPANYGVKNNPPFSYETVYGALRHISLDVASAVLPISGGSVNGTNLVFSFASSDAVLDYYSSLSSSYTGSIVLDGYATNTMPTQATLSTNGNVRTLTILINTTFVYSIFSAQDTSLHFFGQIVATNSIAATIPIIYYLSVTNQSVVIAAENATLESELLVSTNLTSWSQASATTTTNDVGWIIFTTALNGPRAFFRVQQ